MEWITPPYHYNDIFNSMLTHFQIQSLEDWLELIFHAVDSNEVDHGPIIDNSKHALLIFVIFIFLTSFFMINVLITILIEGYQA